MVLFFRPILHSCFRTHHIKRMEALRPELHLRINVIPNQVMRMCTSLLTIVFIVCTRAEATCVQHLLTAYLKSALSAWTAPSLSPWETKKTNRLRACVTVKVLLLRGENHLATWAILKVLCTLKTSIWAHQLFPYIDLPAITLSSSLQNNRAQSEIAIMDKQCDNMRSVWSSGA